MRSYLPVPPNPAVEEMFQDGKKVLVVTINPPTEFHGPITKYRVVVMEQDSLMRFDPDKLVNFAEADRDGLPYYIAGDLKPLQKPLLFIVGSNSSSNPPLAEEQKYDIIVGVISELNGETKSVFSVPSREPASAGLGRANVGASRYLNAEDETDLALRRRDAVLVFILSVAIGVLGFLLVAAFILYFILRQQYASKRRSDELILKIHDHDSESGYFGVNGKLHLEEGADLNGFYSRLCDLYWQIPRPQLHISDIVLGQGMFGLVRVGKILRNGEEISAQIQRCGAHFALSDRERRVLLAELETVVQVGKHPNVVEFIGGCEEGDALWMAVEHPNNPLRGVLLASRQQTENRISSIPEYRLMEIAISLADGMKHLAHRGVCHGCLSTRSVMVHLPEMTPKISNFSISRYTPLGKKLDYTRWTAPEAMRRRVTQKTDVWSFGVLLWELFTFAGTPYVDLKSNEVQARITKGHRLPQPRGVNTSLFQQMLNCWEMDPDERPSFEFLARELRTVASEDPLRFPQQIKYIYDKFDPLADES
ncbi:putative tyrosine-protein kinase Wsck isoform X3 [Varroa destructor]|uniref:Protein kinase domain-containing protein n=1 Tax=Varroa destructor TaxID=109461 RepID=A0A7M7MA59_VARDE|nr:putative tyrosine-protein kinase Wsck isoform X3 [Varroa destructor]